MSVYRTVGPLVGVIDWIVAFLLPVGICENS